MQNPPGRSLLSCALLFLAIPSLTPSLLAAPAGETVAAPEPFVHPGLLHSKSEIEFVRGRIRAGAEPWKTAWEALKSHGHASLEWKSRAHPNVERGPYNRPSVGANEMMRDAPASYTPPQRGW